MKLTEAEYQEQRKQFPPYQRDLSFAAMTSTQFLGAFNDNLFKQLVLLTCVAYVNAQKIETDIYQPIAMFLFAFPFIMLSGFAGYLADRYSKRTIIIGCKVVEILVMFGGFLAFLSFAPASLSLLVGLYIVLFFMASQSAIFGPAKYGVLPEIFRSKDLPSVNGIIQMTTFLAIIFGMALAGLAGSKDGMPIWMMSLISIVLAFAGTATSWFIRESAPGKRIQFDLSSLWVNRETWQLLKQDTMLMRVLVISSVFWMIGGVVQPAVNYFGLNQLDVNQFKTSLLAAAMGIGISLGCVIAGLLSKDQVNFHFVRRGAWGIVSSFLFVTAISLSGLSGEAIYAGCFLGLTLLGISAGFFAVPLQVFLQAKPPEGQKGRVIAAMNLFNWIGICSSAAVYALCSWVFNSALKLPISWTFTVLAMMMLPFAILFRPDNQEL